MTFAARCRFLVALCIICVLIVPTCAQAAYAERPIRLLVGFPAGGGADFTARLVATELGMVFGNQLIVDNRPGANGNIAAQLAAQSTPDGYTLLLIPFNFALSAAMTKNLPFNPVTGFEAVTLIASAPMVLTVNPSSPVRSVPELLILAKDHPRIAFTPCELCAHLVVLVIGVALALALLPAPPTLTLTHGRRAIALLSNLRTRPKRLAACRTSPAFPGNSPHMNRAGSVRECVS
jgi:hypothetical protein